MTRVRTVLTYCIVAVLGGVAGILYLRYVNPPPPVYITTPGPTQYVPVPKKVRDVKVVEVPVPVEVKTIQTIPVEVVREKMKWYDLTDNTILAVGEVPPHRGKTSVAAVATVQDNALGARLVMRQEPPPFLELKKELRIGGFIGTGGAVQGEIAFRPLRIGPVDVVAKGTGTWGDGTNEVRGFVGAELQFGF